MADKNIKRCERCGVSFTCGADDISKCFCNSIVLSDKAKEKIKKNFNDCLCTGCLLYFSEKVN